MITTEQDRLELRAELLHAKLTKRQRRTAAKHLDIDVRDPDLLPAERAVLEAFEDLPY